MHGRATAETQPGGPPEVLLVSCYELGRQPLALASALGFLERDGVRAAAVDLALEPPDDQLLRGTRLVAVSVPMHTALRIGHAFGRRLRRLNPDAHLCYFGPYALLNAETLLDGLADSVLGGEHEQALSRLVAAELAGERGPIPGVVRRGERPAAVLERLDFATPRRQALAPLERYARLEHAGRLRLAGAVEASRGCLHLCTHCPLPPVYRGRLFVVPLEQLLADVRQQVEAGAEHLSLADPDFLNAPGHSLRLARALHREFPRVSFDFTAKVEHLLRHRELLPELQRCGALFVVSALESLDDEVLRRLRKGHVGEDALRLVRQMRELGLALRPTFVPFTPWSGLEGYLELLRFVERERLVEYVDPVQLSIRLLVPPGSLLLEDASLEPCLRGLDREAFAWRWQHPDPRMDELQSAVAARVEQAVRRREDPEQTLAALKLLALERRSDRERGPSRVPRLTESWFC